MRSCSPREACHAVFAPTNAPEFITQDIREWLVRLKIEALHIEPGSPWENGYAESLFSRFRDDFLATQ